MNPALPAIMQRHANALLNTRIAPSLTRRLCFMAGGLEVGGAWRRGRRRKREKRIVNVEEERLDRVKGRT